MGCLQLLLRILCRALTRLLLPALIFEVHVVDEAIVERLWAQEGCKARLILLSGEA